MAITYTWKVDMMHTQSKLSIQNAVTEIHWSKTGTDGAGIIGRYPGCTKFKIQDVDAENFAPLESLTETQVLNWVKNTITGDDMVFIDAQIASSIDSQKNQKTVGSIDATNLPWAK